MSHVHKLCTNYQRRQPVVQRRGLRDVVGTGSLPMDVPLDEFDRFLDAYGFVECETWKVSADCAEFSEFSTI